MSRDRKAIVVSFADASAFSPRVQRTAHVVSALEQQFDFRVERVPAQPGHGMGPFKTPLARRVAWRALRPLALDSFELPARVALRGWKPAGRGALLIGWPFSPAHMAASRLVAAGIPYVVDAGDPWALTEPVPPRWTRRLSRRRAKRAERFLWRHAAAGVITTKAQAGSLRALFPDLELLCRPNGYTPAEPVVDGEPRDALMQREELRLVHFGAVNPFRLPLGEWLAMLRSEAGLRRVRFANYGSVDSPELLECRDPAVEIEAHDPVEWGRACEIARDFDAAVVVANINPTELPSKSIQYLTLPIPRVAVTGGGEGDELGAFAAERPGFIAVHVDSREDIPHLIAHLQHEWSAEELRPPPGDSWAEVAREIVGFAVEAWDRQLASPAARRASLPATKPKPTIIQR